MSLFFKIENQEKFQTNSPVHNINTRSKHHFHRQVDNLSCFQKGTSYSGIKIFNSLPRSIISILDFKLSPCSKSFMLSSGLFHGVWILCADVSEHTVCSIFICRRLCEEDNRLPMKMEQCVPKRRHTKFRCRGITQRKAYNKYYKP